jgi:hypothetical protein
MSKTTGDADRRDVAAGVAAYFRSTQWNELVRLLRTLEPESHVHAFVKTSLHPDTLEALIKRQLHAIGLGVSRSNEILCPAPSRGTLHGIHPAGAAHFDINWIYDSGVAIEPLDDARGEQGKNLLYWDPAYMDAFYRGYEWRTVGAAEATRIREYLSSDHWDRGFDLIMDPEIVHIHVNVDTSVHPTVLAKFVTEAIAARVGWKLHRIVPNVVRSEGIYYGKLMLLFEEPEVSFDVGWNYDQKKILEPCGRQIFPGQREPGYMIVPARDLDHLLAQDPYRRLTVDQIRECLMAVETGL